MPLFATEWRLDTSADPVTLTLRTPDGDLIYTPANGKPFNTMCGNEFYLVSNPSYCDAAKCICVGPTNCDRGFLFYPGGGVGCPVPPCPFPRKVCVDMAPLFGAQYEVLQIADCTHHPLSNGPYPLLGPDGEILPGRNDDWAVKFCPPKVCVDLSEPGCGQTGITIIASNPNSLGQVMWVQVFNNPNLRVIIRLGTQLLREYRTPWPICEWPVNVVDVGYNNQHCPGFFDHSFPPFGSDQFQVNIGLPESLSVDIE